MNDTLRTTIIEILQSAEQKPVAGIRLKAWRITLSQTQKVDLGIKNNLAGSVYTPPSYSERESGEVFLIWEDGKCSRARIQNTNHSGDKYWAEQLMLWRLTAYKDHYDIHIPSPPEELPQVKIANKEILNLIVTDSRYIFNQQQKFLSDRPYNALTNADLSAWWIRNLLDTSTGIVADYPESRYAVSWSFDSQISQGFVGRSLPASEELQSLWEESVGRYQLLQNPGRPVTEETVVILAPGVLEQVLKQYILPNFRGENILEGQSRFIVSDFRRNLQFFAEGLSLEIDPLKPDNWSSYLLTAEGVPAVRTVLVEDGCLVTPYLNVKDAKRWQTQPTAIPTGPKGITLKHRNQGSWTDKIREVKDGVLVLSVLGLHTQNPVSGNYSLSAPSSLRIENGSLTGRIDVRIGGNIWDLLKSEETAYAFSDPHPHPYMVTYSYVNQL